uniref:DEAD domain-containing protein n=1 Tax=Strongyloides stercoralis TaxID=6248 RepID=A0A0K0EK68_STRER
MLTHIENLNLRHNFQKLFGNNLYYLQKESFDYIKDGCSVFLKTANLMGKTTAYLAPFFDYYLMKPENATKQHKIFVICPTLKLEEQVYQTSICLLFQTNGLTVTKVYVGVKKTISMQNVFVGFSLLVATSRQLLKILRRCEITLQFLETFVIEKADRMF